MNNFLLKQEQFEKLYSDSVTKKEYDTIISLINDRFYEIMKTLKPKLEWVDFNNGYDETDGHFDPQDYKEYIGYEGRNVELPEPWDNSEIPTRWLWEENFEEEFKSEVEKEKAKKEDAKRKRIENEEQKKLRNQQIWDGIKSKLTKEETIYLLNKMKKGVKR